MESKITTLEQKTIKYTFPVIFSVMALDTSLSRDTKIHIGNTRNINDQKDLAQTSLNYTGEPLPQNKHC